MYIYKELEIMETFDHEPTEVDLDNYEVGFTDGYDDFRLGGELHFEMREEESIWRRGHGVAPTLVSGPDLWYALGVIRGFEHASEDSVGARG